MYSCSYDAAVGPPNPHRVVLGELPDVDPFTVPDAVLVDLDLGDPKVMDALMAGAYG